MKKINLALQQYSVREDFDRDPIGTMKEVKAMGYDGMELNLWTLKEEPEFYREGLEKHGLKCFSTMEDWRYLGEDYLPKKMDACKRLCSEVLVIGMVEKERLETDPDYPDQVIARMNDLTGILRDHGIRTGYHSHDIDSKKINGKAFYEMIMEQTPQEFQMIMDTGNTQGGGDDPLTLLKKFPGRTPLFHLKGYNDETKYLTPLWESSLDWDAVLTQALDHCGTETLVVEFGKRGEYDPMERAEKSLLWLKKQLQKMGRM